MCLLFSRSRCVVRRKAVRERRRVASRRLFSLGDAAAEINAVCIFDSHDTILNVRSVFLARMHPYTCDVYHREMHLSQNFYPTKRLSFFLSLLLLFLPLSTRVSIGKLENRVI